jgi:type II restriction enzyme
MLQPSLFGIKKCNRDFTKKNSWGKNQFNSSFPASLCAFLESKNLNAKYLTIKDSNFTVSDISISDLFGVSTTDSDKIFYAFESAYSPYNTYVTGSLPRTDLVIQDPISKKCLRGLEVKLTALPDQTTFDKDEKDYGSEIVIRPDTIVYLACSLIETIEGSTFSFNSIDRIDLTNWDEPSEAIEVIELILANLLKITNELEGEESPVLLQPIWKTQGKSPVLSDNCLDIFAWSNLGLTRFIHDVSTPAIKTRKITRQYRTSIWLYKMIQDYFDNGSFDHEEIIDRLSYNLKNDKAFSSSGAINNKFMKCEELAKPRIEKADIKNIILGNGQDLLSPERRFDAIIFNSPDIFE